jgi:hypothetical protein
MQGQEPDPPEDWHEGDRGVYGSSDDTSDSTDRTAVGGPAEQV